MTVCRRYIGVWWTSWRGGNDMAEYIELLPQLYCRRIADRPVIVCDTDFCSYGKA